MTEKDNWKYKLIRKLANILNVDLIEAWKAPAYGRSIKLLERSAECNIHVDCLKVIADKYDDGVIAVADLAHYMEIDPAKAFPELDEGQLETLRGYIQGDINSEQYALKGNMNSKKSPYKIEAYREVLDHIDEIKEDWNGNNSDEEK